MWLAITFCAFNLISSQAYFYSWIEWDQLNRSQKKAAACLGYNEAKWNCHLFTNIHSNYWWNNLGPIEKECASTLGYDEETWNNVSAPPPSNAYNDIF